MLLRCGSFGRHCTTFWIQVNSTKFSLVTDELAPNWSSEWGKLSTTMTIRKVKQWSCSGAANQLVFLLSLSPSYVSTFPPLFNITYLGERKTALLIFYSLFYYRTKESTASSRLPFKLRCTRLENMKFWTGLKPKHLRWEDFLWERWKWIHYYYMKNDDGGWMMGLPLHRYQAIYACSHI